MVCETIRVRGTVQGVGFRPFVWQLAARLGIAGEVSNDGEGVLVRAQGESDQLDAFAAAIVAEAPPLARVTSIERVPLPAFSASGFTIAETTGGTRRTGITPDAAMCAACAAEIGDPGQRRFGYAFTNCTHCGPRFSIVDAIPYDRTATRMRAFTMCADCRNDYDNPADRRFHAQPIACPDCGPRVDMQLAEVVVALKAGAIVALKGLGGFHLACDATNEAAVSTLRARKRRPHKPFALMACHIGMIGKFARVSAAEALLLGDPAAPIVVLPGKNAALAASVAPGLDRIGWMLAYTPLHRLLCDGIDRPLVMTSGNLSGEPQVVDNEEALVKLSGFADRFLMHDREISRRLDDSVATVVGGQLRVQRRARGYSPAPLEMPRGLRHAPPVLALGGELKAAICLGFGSEAVLSHHLGDLEDAHTYDAFEAAIDDYERLFGHTPQAIACDWHPAYRSVQKAEEMAADRRLPLVRVQHHHAHIAACMAENGWPVDGGKVLGIAFDGTGYGGDGAVWGGEWLLADYRGFERLATLKPVRLPGADVAVREPWRNLLAHIVSAFGYQGGMARLRDAGLADAFEGKPVSAVVRMIESGFNSPESTSAGRLFDAVGAALGCAFDRVTYEGQAAVELESLACPDAAATAYRYGRKTVDGVVHVDPGPMWETLLAQRADGVPGGLIAWRFHAGLAEAAGCLAVSLARRHGARAIALSGGVMQNGLFLSLLLDALSQQDLPVLSHRQVPSNDGGIAFGQVAIAASQLLGK